MLALVRTNAHSEHSEMWDWLWSGENESGRTAIEL